MPPSGVPRRRVGDEVLEPLLGAGDRRLERDRLAREAVERLERIGVRAERRRELRGGRLAAELARQLRAHALAALQPVVDVRRQPDRARVVLDRAHQRLADPPDRVGRELEAAAVVELLDRADQAEVALLDQVRERQAEVAVVLRDRDHELQVVLDEAVLHRRSCARARPRPWSTSSSMASFAARRPRARDRESACVPLRAPRISLGDAQRRARAARRARRARAARLCISSAIFSSTRSTSPGRAAASTCSSRSREQHAQLLHRALDARRDLAGLLVARPTRRAWRPCARARAARPSARRRGGRSAGIE